MFFVSKALQQINKHFIVLAKAPTRLKSDLQHASKYDFAKHMTLLDENKRIKKTCLVIGQ